MGKTIWSEILVRSNVVTGIGALGAAIPAIVLSGPLALNSIMLSWLLVAGGLSVSLAVVSCVWVRFPAWAMPLAVCVFAAKTAALGFFLITVAPKLSCDKVWLPCSALGFLVVWQSTEMAVVIKNRQGGNENSEG